MNIPDTSDLDLNEREAVTKMVDAILSGKVKSAKLWAQRWKEIQHDLDKILKDA